MKFQKGFTIIELIVVIAIIAILASIVLVNVTQYINKANNAAITGNLATLLTNSAVYFETNSSNTGSQFVADNTTGFGATSPIYTAVNTANGSNAPSSVGSTTTQAWCATTATLAVGSTAASTFCVDSTGYKGVLVSGKCTTGVFTCQ